MDRKPQLGQSEVILRESDPPALITISPSWEVQTGELPVVLDGCPVIGAGSALFAIMRKTTGLSTVLSPVRRGILF